MLVHKMNAQRVENTRRKGGGKKKRRKRADAWHAGAGLIEDVGDSSGTGFEGGGSAGLLLAYLKMAVGCWRSSRRWR